MARTRKAEVSTPDATEAPDHAQKITPSADAGGAIATQEVRLATKESPPAGPQPDDVVTPVKLPWVRGVSDVGQEQLRQAAREGTPDQPAYAADPHEKISVSLSGIPGGPAMHLLRSHKFKQMQIRFDHGQPDEQYLKMLTDRGWKDRTEAEGVYTKQIDPHARWQSVQKMEQEFKDVANAIRKDKKLEPVLMEGLGA